jgi:hypothetical protein
MQHIITKHFAIQKNVRTNRFDTESREVCVRVTDFRSQSTTAFVASSATGTIPPAKKRSIPFVTPDWKTQNDGHRSAVCGTT